MLNIAIINGPNLNLLGKREPSIYGSRSFEDYYEELREFYSAQVALSYFQSNHEGALLDYIQNIGFSVDGIILNAGAYTHTSIALGDCIRAISAPVLEVHISNVHAREPFRQVSHLSAACVGGLFGLGLEGYRLGIAYFLGANS